MKKWETVKKNHLNAAHGRIVIFKNELKVARQTVKMKEAQVEETKKEIKDLKKQKVAVTMRHTGRLI